MRKSFEELTQEELIRLDKGEIKEYIGDDYREGLAMVKAVMRQCKDEVGYSARFDRVNRAWSNKKVRIAVWSVQTFLIVVFYSMTWIWLTSLLIGLLFAGIAAAHRWRMNKACRMVQNHFEALDGITLDMQTLHQLYNDELPDEL